MKKKALIGIKIASFKYKKVLEEKCSKPTTNRMRLVNDEMQLEKSLARHRKLLQV